MADLRFIKVVAFGGYDKTDVDKRLELLYDQIFELKNELREAKLVLKKYEEGSDSEKAFENAIAVERGMLTQLQVKNANLSEKNKALSEDNNQKEKELAEIKEELAQAKEKLKENALTISTLKSTNSGEALSIIFREAQKSHDLLINEAKKEVEALESASKQFAEDVIADANNKAKKTIYEAERQAAEIIADAKTSTEQMNVASDNLKTVMLADINKLNYEVSNLRKLFEDFEKQSLTTLGDSEKLLEKAENELKSGGVPVFRQPEIFAPEYPEAPIYDTGSSAASNENKTENKKNSQLDKLQAMAEAIGSGNKKTDISLDELAKQAQSIGVSDQKGTEAPQKEETKKKGTIDLAELARQAAALEG